MMKHFLLFVGLHYYPSPGIGDFVGAYETLAAAKEGFAEYPERFPGDMCVPLLGQYWAEIAEWDGETLMAVESWPSYSADSPLRLLDAWHTLREL